MNPYASGYHEPVLCKAVVNGLVGKPDGYYVDATLGGGGHTAALLDALGPDARVVGIDQDDDALEEAGSRLQAGDDAASNIPLAALTGRHVVIEEKLDGANAALSFDQDGALLLQSRGHYLTGGGRERHFALFKAWAGAHAPALRSRLGARFILFGEWLYAKHTIFYDALPHYFLEFDVFDRAEARFLSTSARADLLRGLPVQPVPVLYEGLVSDEAALQALVRPALYKSRRWRRALSDVARAERLDPARAERETDPSDLAEGLYLKVETEAETVERYKWVRSGFLQAVEAADSHWLTRPILPNQLAPGVDLMAPRHGAAGAYDA